MTPDTHWTDRHAYVRLPEDYPGQAEDAATIARLFVTERVSYSFASYAALAAWKYGLRTPRLEAWIGRRREPILITDHNDVATAHSRRCRARRSAPSSPTRHGPSPGTASCKASHTRPSHPAPWPGNCGTAPAPPGAAKDSQPRTPTRGG
jgi:hypothetical protein